MTADTDTSQTLGGESLLRRIEGQMRRLIQGAQSGVGSVKRLNQLGIEFNRSGTLQLDENKFKSVLANDPDAVHRFFAGDGFSVGFVPSLKNVLQSILDTSFGPVSVRKKSLQDKIRRVDQQIENKERSLIRKEQTLRRKFAKLEETMSRLKSQGTSMAALGGGGNALNFSGASLGR